MSDKIMSAEEIINEMVDVMPFKFNESMKPYIIEAMRYYHREKVKDELISFVNWFNKTDRTQSIINQRVNEYLTQKNKSNE